MFPDGQQLFLQWSLEIWNRLFPAHFEVLNVAPGQFNYAIANIDLGCSCKLLLKANTGQLPQADTFLGLMIKPLA